LLFFVPIFSGRQAGFPWFSPPPTSVARVPISKLSALSACSVPRFLCVPSDVALAETPHFRPFPARQASPTLGPNGSQDVPGGLTPCRFGTQQPWLAPLFQLPDLPAQRHYEICRAYFHDETPADEITQRFHLHVGSVRAIVRDFARDPDLNAFFATARPGRKTSPKRDAIHQRACELRRQGATLADIRAALQREGF